MVVHNAGHSDHQTNIYIVLRKCYVVGTESSYTVMNVGALVAIVVLLFLMAECGIGIVNLALIILTLWLGLTL